MRHVMPRAVAESVALRTPTLRDRPSAALFEALTGQRPSGAGTTWYDAHAKRRHGIVHEGLEVTDEEAQHSIQSVQALISWLDPVVGYGLTGIARQPARPSQRGGGRSIWAAPERDCRPASSRGPSNQQTPPRRTSGALTTTLATTRSRATHR